MNDKQRQQTALRQQRYRQRQQAARAQEQACKGLPPLPSIPTMPGYGRWQASLCAAQALVEQVVSEMAAYSEERSDAWQESEAAERFRERQEAVEAALSQLEEAVMF
jgi:hypothetical protein